ncbi:trehalose-6-phosphate synthase [Actinocrinis puniceicyclus]|uniref:Trehalose-6-phosphate synthase n=1 Tax=Actinocrinis puniceicyclus TaxID=977794 RepID=A0A8J8BDT3_9ACTN|nr:trehalose-6-phosphate synthase [Actinocrinis puniceicyclus]MBS2965603.1 trehalose-6-phosphate synthase [Actinocrinis puniceicyclus]
MSGPGGDGAGARPEPGKATVLVASNRGPVSFSVGNDGDLHAKRGGGGLVSGLSSVAAEGEADQVWVCAALTEGDRAAARRAPGGRLDRAGLTDASSPVRMLDIDPGTLHRAYNAVANSTLWFIHHMLYATPFSPVFDGRFGREWESYVAYNRAFAEALAEEAAPRARVLVQDYHLALVPKMLRELRPDLRIGHFSHTPWAPPEYFGILPDAVASAVLEGMLGADQLGFLTERWALAFMDCCARQFGAAVDRERMTVTAPHRGTPTRIGVYSLGVDADFIVERAMRPDVEARLASLRESVGDRQVIVRVDRTELSKNIVRGLDAYADLLRRHPEWLGRVVHVAFAYPSRHDLPEYREYTAAVLRTAKQIEDEFGTPQWEPLILHVEDDFARSLAAYRLADVAVVNAIRDGMNLVAKEIPIVATATGGSCGLVLSREAGACAEMAQDALVVNPYDVTGTAEALHAALSMDREERRRRCERLAAAGAALPPQRWFARQLADLTSDE